MTPRPIASVFGGAACLLASTAMAPLFAGTIWWLRPVLIATVVGVGTAVLGRHVGRSIRHPALTGFCLSLVGLCTSVTAVGAHDAALLGVIPTPASTSALYDLATPIRDEIRQLAVPVPEQPGLVVLILVATYVVVMAVDLLVVVVDRPALAGIPLLALFLVPAAILPAGVGTLPFVLGAIGFVALMLLDGNRMVTRWGRLTGDRSPRMISNGLGGLGAQIAAGCLVIAAVVPLVLPSLDGRGVVNRGNATGASEGRSSASVIQPIVSLSQQIHNEREVPLLRVSTATPNYLRLTALENFDGQRFTLRTLNATKDARVSEGLPGPEADVRTVPAEATVTISKEMTERYLPVPGIPTRFDGLVGDWRLAEPTGTVFSTRTSTAGLRYTVQAEVPDPTSEQIRAATGAVPDSMGVVTALPTGLDPRLPALLDRVTAGAVPGYAKVVAIQNYLRGPDFTYDLTGAPTAQDGALADFLFSSRRGYCEQFASAMAVLVRLLGLPSRVAIGFTHGTQQSDGSWLITNKQAHAWPEVWFPTLGWIPFEPTRRTDGSTPAPDYAPSTDPADDAGASSAPEADEAVGVEPTPVVTPVPADPGAIDEEPEQPVGSAAKGARTHSFPPPWLPWAGLGLGVLGLLSVPALTRLVLRRRRMAAGPHGSAGSAAPTDAELVARVHAVWAELVDIAADLGIRLRSSDSPRSGAQRLISFLEAGPEAGSPEILAARDALMRLATAQERARYAPPGTIAFSPALLTDLALARRVLWSVTPRGRRAMATVAPPSVLRRITPGQDDRPVLAATGSGPREGS
ncbi:transglutaminaseTgpA domain-containing protein [Parafrankia sp. EUN1f]|uniref:transglutaminaseTgpA domain-containing protein n=1 Tax=Parafrankia sp. EUN1f TaxID=102897 RepID=UPI0001C44347|nr:transglutaminaseTgpA domain-containing protein [Parafrankia sp. EUN1f]EFC83817.1 transglutaminase domain protein [Parafrankia sp. EUN1f]